ncbi:MAG: ATP-binding cassette domain-containing protein, partial [Faecalibacillus intestinalis]|uniref:ATP-binding cassette domain-containing protein n=1 Tax=Faecalibacillus intestinalis TaxID=1982626 RepID=UPI0039A20731
MLVSMTDLTKYNGEKCILDHIELHIEDKDKVGILGVNGTGKSTLLKIIAGIEDYQGKISYQKDIRINYLPQTPLYNEDDSIMETVYKQLDSKEIHDYEIKAQLGKFGIIDETQKIKELSGGQLKRVALAIALIKPCDLLILDEPTNHLDNGMIEYLEKFLIKWSKGLLMVTHDRYFLERVVNRIIEIDHGQIYKYEANYSKYLELKQVRLETQLSSQRKRKLFLKKELEWVRAGVQARTS